MNEAEAGRPASRRGGLTVSTLLALVAAIGVGLAVTRTLPSYLYVMGDHRQVVQDYVLTGPSSVSWTSRAAGDFGRPIIPKVPSSQMSRRLSYWFGHLPYWSGPCLVSLSVAALGLGLRRPRPALRRVARSPGMAAGVAVILAMGVGFATNILPRLVRWRGPDSLSNILEGSWPYFWITQPARAGFVVAVMWLTLALSGRWAPAADGRERLGRAVGWSWIALGASSTASDWLGMFDL